MLLKMQLNYRKIIRCVAFSAFMATAASFPFAVVVREAIELTPRHISVDLFERNYRKALWYFWNYENSSLGFAGLFKKYFYKNFPWMFIVS